MNILDDEEDYPECLSGGLPPAKFAIPRAFLRFLENLFASAGELFEELKCYLDAKGEEEVEAREARQMQDALEFLEEA